MPVLERRQGTVLELIIDDEEHRNPLSAETVWGLRAGLGRVRTDDLRCVVVRSIGETVFCAGADLSTLRDGGRQVLEMDLFGLFAEVETCAAPVVVAVQGAALGGGFELALCADLVFAAPESEFGLPETTLGLAPGIAMVRLYREIGHHRAMELALTRRRLSATEAAALGLVNRVVERDALVAAALTVAADVASRAPLGVRATKRAMNRERGGDDWAHVRAAMEGLFRTADLAEGLDAFAQRRPPVFQGR